MNTRERLENSISESTGWTADHIRRSTLAELREDSERRAGRRTVFCSKFPLIGRGNVNRQGVVDHQLILDSLEAVLR